MKVRSKRVIQLLWIEFGSLLYCFHLAHAVNMTSVDLLADGVRRFIPSQERAYRDPNLEQELEIETKREPERQSDKLRDELLASKIGESLCVDRGFLSLDLKEPPLYRESTDLEAAKLAQAGRLYYPWTYVLERSAFDEATGLSKVLGFGAIGMVSLYVLSHQAFLSLLGSEIFKLEVFKPNDSTDHGTSNEQQWAAYSCPSLILSAFTSCIYLSWREIKLLLMDQKAISNDEPLPNESFFRVKVYDYSAPKVNHLEFTRLKCLKWKPI